MRFRALLASGRELLTLREAEERAVALPSARRAAVRALTRAALDHLDAVASLVGPSTRGAAHTLLREAVILLVCAHASAAGVEGDAITSDPATALAAHPGLPQPECVGRALARGPSLASVTTPDDERTDEIEALSAAAAWLLAPLESRAPRQLRLARRIRITAGAGVVLLAVGLALGAKRTSPNAALHKTVTTSGLDTRSPAVEALVDGAPFGAYGARTTVGPSPWIMVDLGGSYALDDVVVYQRGDGNNEDGLPLVIELSIDAQEFAVLGRRTERFSQDHPFRLTTGGARGRYVRVRLDRPGYLALTEIEVHAIK